MRADTLPGVPAQVGSGAPSIGGRTPDTGWRAVAVNSELRIANCGGDRRAPTSYSHSIVAGGLDETSYATRLMPATSLITRDEMRSNTS